MMRIVDIMYSLPFMFFVILLMVFFGRNIVLMFVAIGAVEWLDMARIVRGQTLALKQREFVEAAHALGVAPIARSSPATSCPTPGPGDRLRHADRAQGHPARESSCRSWGSACRSR